MKKCYRCKEIKPIEEMSATKGFCKPCKRENSREYNLKNREKVLETMKLYREKNKEKLKANRKQQPFEKRKAYKEANKEYISIKRKEYNSRPDILEKRRLYRLKYAEKLKLSKPPKVKKEKVVKVKPPVRTLEEKRAYRRAYKKHKKATDVNYRMRINLSKRLYGVLHKTHVKSASIIELLACDILFFRSYLENKFLPTMTWDNYGTVWHIDHIMPCAKFNLADPEEQKRCFHYTNLQPLFAVTTVIDGVTYIGNLNKQDRIIQLVA
jgi:hypothetical protein